MNVFPVIMAGGSGKRLWPESRGARPKQFLSLLSDDPRSLLRATLERMKNVAPVSSCFLVSSRAYAPLIAKETPELPPERVLLEPMPRNTAPCVAWAALEALRLDPDAVLIVLPSDHLIEPADAFQETLRRAVATVENDPTALAALGIRPTYPASIYGYVERTELANDYGLFRALRFHEKPDVEKAKTYVESGSYFWNAGIFVWKARTFVELLQRFEPEFVGTIAKMSARIDAARQNGTRPDDDPEFVDAFCAAKSISIDYAVMERADNVWIAPVDEFQWNDLGSFDALEEEERKRAAASFHANLISGGELLAENASGNYVRVRSEDRADAKENAESKRKLVVLVDVDDLLVVETDDALVIKRKSGPTPLDSVVKSACGIENYL